jgi:hypothetical protein
MTQHSSAYSITHHICGLLCLLIACSAEASPATSQSEVVYQNPERTFQETISETSWTGTPLVSETSDNGESESDPFPESVSSSVVNCSDSMYMCVQAVSRTIAIPRAGFKPHDKYEKDGVIFHVETCIRGDSARCQVALVSAKCADRNDHRPYGCAQPPRTGQSPRFRYVIYFLYNDQYGITAMGVTSRIAKTISAMRLVATQSILVGTKGLLKN